MYAEKPTTNKNNYSYQERSSESQIKTFIEKGCGVFKNSVLDTAETAAILTNFLKKVLHPCKYNKQYGPLIYIYVHICMYIKSPKENKIKAN